MHQNDKLEGHNNSENNAVKHLVEAQALEAKAIKDAIAGHPEKAASETAASIGQTAKALEELEAKKHKTVSVFVNQDEHEIDKGKISYERVVDLYIGQGGAPSTEYLIKYSHGPSKNPSGTLAPGQQVEVKDGMRFRVTGTGES